MTIITAPEQTSNAPDWVSLLGTETITLRGWSVNGYIQPTADGLVHVMLQQEPTNDAFTDRLTAIPTWCWDHLPAARQRPKPGFVWGNRGEGIEKYVQFTYIGLYEIVSEITDSTGEPITTFRRANRDA